MNFAPPLRNVFRRISESSWGAATKELAESNIMDGVIKVGDRLPAFSLPNSFDETIESSELLAAGPVVLTVFRGVW